MASWDDLKEDVCARRLTGKLVLQLLIVSTQGRLRQCGFRFYFVIRSYVLSPSSAQSLEPSYVLRMLVDSLRERMLCWDQRAAQDTPGRGAIL